MNDRFKCFVFLRQLQMHESMSQREVVEDLFRIVNLKIARREMIEVRLQFVRPEASRHSPADLFGEQFALLFLGADEIRSSSQQRHRLAIEHPEQRIFKAIPQFGTGPL